MLKMQGVSFEIRGKQILKDINLEVRSGEVVGVVGKNGAGKSTAIHIASGIRRPTTGVVTYDGRDIEDISSQDLGKMRSVLSQSISLGLEVSVLDVLLMSRYPYRPLSSSDYEVVDKVCEDFQLWPLIKRPLSSLSGGERQKVMFAKSVAQISPFHEKTLFFLDEPTNSLDLEVQQLILKTSQKMARRHGVGVLLIIHDLNQAAAYCDRIYMLHKGEVVSQGAPQTTLTESNLERFFGVRAKVSFENNNKEIPVITV